ncbi:sigma-70 family RNA polymerase sigma factor [Rhodoferax sp.]|uniref:sigma-70 family RNA polymerase sigma factor n=1 Tax=Rhodoferax sp. TaxID=50421 RepID=UPI00374D630F
MSSHPLSATVETLYLAHYRWLLGWLLRKLGCAHHAADLGQDTFVRLLELPAVPLIREPRAYLMVLANRLMINRYHRQRVEDDTLRTLAILAEGQQHASAEDAAAAQQAMGQIVALLVHEVGEKPGTAFLLARLHGESYSAIAERLGVSETRVKQYLATVLAHCHARLVQTGRQA